jgi:branched-chain amino acid transport system substrate-binding protein
MGLGALLVAGCAAEGTGSGSAGGDDSAPVKVGVVTSTSGPLSAYGNQFVDGFEAGLDYATDGSNEVDGRPVEVTYEDDASDPAKATSAATSLIGKGFKILTGPVSSAVAVQMAPLAEQNKVLLISGPAATDAVTGINDYTFRSGRQTYQDVVAAANIVGDVAGKKVVVFAQDYEFGQANVAAVQQVLGEERGAEVVPVLSPVEASDFTPFARQAVDAKPDLVFVAWAGETTNAMWQTLEQQGLFKQAPVVTGLADRASFNMFGSAATKITFLSHYFGGVTDNEPNKALNEYLGGKADIFHNDGFVAAQMVVRAIEEGGGDDVEAMISGLEGWQFTGPKGDQEVRAEDHALLQPMFSAKLVDEGGSLTPELVDTFSPEDVAPPVAGQ